MLKSYNWLYLLVVKAATNNKTITISEQALVYSITLDDWLPG